MHCIANVTNRWGIGCGGQLAVSIKADLRQFRLLTTGHTVLLGRKTLATFPGGRPLKDRRNIVLTRDPNFTVEGAEVIHSLDEALALARELGDELWVIGGESIYAQLVPYCTEAHMTKTDLDVPVDAFFPDLDALPNWHTVGEAEMQEENGVRFAFVDYVNDAPLPY